MLERSSVRYLVVLYISDMVITVGALLLASLLRHWIPLGKEPTSLGQPTLPIYLIVVFVWSLTFWFLSVYSPKAVLNAIAEAQKVILAVTASVLALAGMLFLTYRGLSRLLLGYFFLIDIVGIIVMRTLLRIAFKARGPGHMAHHKVLIIGAGAVGQDLAAKITERRWVGLDVIGFLDDDPNKVGARFQGYPVLAPLSESASVIEAHRVDEVVIALPLWAHKAMRDLVVRLQELPVNIKVVPDFFALTLFSASMEDLDGIPLIGLKEPVISGVTQIAKRVMDLVVGTLALIAVSPVLLIIAILIKLDSKGPVIFRHARVGQNGRLFQMVKFRTMRVGAEEEEQDLLVTQENGQQVFEKRPDDPRVTRLGRHLRRMSLDEWPQLFNVLKGDMSLVGPRPELPFLVQLYEPWQRRRFGVPQGMTGWWQVNDRSDKPMHLHTEDDLYYIQNYSLLLDIKILWHTIGAVLRGRGAY